jgi:hypothetical protein
LFENKVTFESIARRSQRLRAARDYDHIWTQNPPLLQKFVHGRPDPLVKAAQYGSVGHVSLRMRLEVEEPFS